MEEGGKTWIAIASGLSVGAQEALADLKTELLVEWLTGESGSMQVRSTWRSGQSVANL